LNKSLTPFDFDQKPNLFKQSLSCPPVEAQLSIDLEAKAHAYATMALMLPEQLHLQLLAS